MKSKAIAALLLLVAGLPAVGADEFYRDFRTAEFDGASFEMAGVGADQFVEATPDGLRIKFLDGVNHEPIGISLRFHVVGDFEITTAYDIKTLDSPKTGYGVGIGIYVETDSPTKEGLTLERFVVPKAQEIFASTRASMKNGERTYASRRFPARASRSGQLRLSRRGARITASMAEGEETTFRKLQSVNVAPGALFYVRLAGDTGGSPSKLDATFKDIRIKTGDLPDEPLSEPIKKVEPPPVAKAEDPIPVPDLREPSTIQLLTWAILAIGVAAVLGVGLFALSRRR